MLEDKEIKHTVSQTSWLNVFIYLLLPFNSFIVYMNAHGFSCAIVGVREQHSAASSLLTPCGVNLRPSAWHQEPLPAEQSHSQVPRKILQGSADSGTLAGWSKQIDLCQRLVSRLNSPSLFLVILPKNKLVILSSKPILSSPISLSLCWEINFKPRMTFDLILSAKVVFFQTVEINHWESMGDRVSTGGNLWAEESVLGSLWTRGSALVIYRRQD